MDAGETGVRSILARFTAALERGDADGAAACFAPDATYSEPPRFTFAGRDAIAAFFADFTARHRDVNFTIARVMADSPSRAEEGLGARSAAVEWRFAYTRTSDGDRMVFVGMCWLDLAADGQIAQWRGFSARLAE